MARMKKIVHLIAGARPNFIKLAPLWRSLKDMAWCDPRIIHTGQHDTQEMSGVFFAELNLPRPHVQLPSDGSVESVMKFYKSFLCYDRPYATIVIGDVNSTAGAALAAAYAGVPVVHLEAGLRSFDQSMPEEINRVITDAVSSLLWVHSREAMDNLVREDRRGMIEFVGNILADTLRLYGPSIRMRDEPYTLVTLHRPSNVDNAERLLACIKAIASIPGEIRWVLHPRTERKLVDFGIKLPSSFRMYTPCGYSEFIDLLASASVVVTDSGGVQEETTLLRVPCLTLRPNTERPVTLLATNFLTTPENLLRDWAASAQMSWYPLPDLWDGFTADRCAASLRAFLDA